MSNVALTTTSKHRQDVKVDPVILCAADERYAMPLSVTLLSAVRSLKPGHSLHVYLVDGGICESSRARLEKTLADEPVRLQWVEPDLANLSDLSISHHISRTAYLRLLADRWLPDDIDRVIYLDSDLIIRDSLTELWEQPLDGEYLLAVPDIACPFIDASCKRNDVPGALPYLASWRPVPNYRDLGLSGSAPYFNSGVMVMNLSAWRRQGLGDRLLQTLRENERFIWCWDQYALNVVCAGHWRPLPMRWNVGAHLYEYPSADRRPVSSHEFEQMAANPAVIHFTTEFKPWDDHCTHPLRDTFFDYLDETEWRGWRPPPAAFDLRERWDRLAVWICRQSTINFRKLRLLGG